MAYNFRQLMSDVRATKGFKIHVKIDELGWPIEEIDNFGNATVDFVDTKVTPEGKVIVDPKRGLEGRIVLQFTFKPETVGVFAVRSGKRLVNPAKLLFSVVG